MITFAYCLFLITFLTSITGSLQATCDENEFSCKDKTCIDSFLVCDGEENCPDGSDETKQLCSKANIRCPPYSFRCAYGPCIDATKKCNKVKDCADNSDETHPDCSGSSLQYNNDSLSGGECSSLTQFQCDSGQCITQYSVCDGEENCRDGSDETEARCINFNCPIVGFQCSYGGCIDKDKKCNGIKDCKDNSDEDPLICTPSQPSYPVFPPPGFSSGSSKGGCVLPDYPEGGSYTVGNCEDKRSPKCRGEPGTLVEPSTFITYNCWKGFGLSSELSNKSFCYESTWDPPLPTCLKLCSPLKDDSLIIKCTYKDSPVNCNHPVKPKTKASLRCKLYHTIKDSVLRDNPVCKSNGLWSEPPLTCKAVCGKKTSNNVAQLISGGITVQAPDYPWYVGLYNALTKSHFCGGSIISPYAVLTAAHCLFEQSNGAPLKTSVIRLAVGKSFRDWATNEKNEQRFEVANQYIHPSYNGRGFSFGFDLAILAIKGFIVVGDLAMPVCIDEIPPWTTIHNGQIGTVVGFGNDANRKQTDELKAVNVTYAGSRECKQIAPANFKDFVTPDKFCGIYTNEAGPQQGDSGGGIVFLKAESNMYFIRGVVSTKPQDRNQFATFTNISEKTHIDFIKEKMNEINQLHGNT